jgi:hypothetical protein
MISSRKDTGDNPGHELIRVSFPFGQDTEKTLLKRTRERTRRDTVIRGTGGDSFGATGSVARL